jgi:hypothetical protein
MNVQDRVTEMRLVPADQLIANPANWRRHPQAQQRALAAVLDEVGFAGAVIAREDEDGGLVIIDGHARAEMVGDATVPVLVTDLTEAEADVVLATYDPIGAMAVRDDEALLRLLDRTEANNEVLEGLLEGLGEQAGAFKVGEGDWGELSPEDGPPFRTMTFTLAAAQVPGVERALSMAKDNGASESDQNQNSNGNALAAIAEFYLAG